MNRLDPSSSHRGSFVLLVLAAFVIVCAGVKLAAPVLIPIVLGAFIATVNLPLVLWLLQHRVPISFTIAGALVSDAVILGGFSWLLVASAAQLSDRLPLYVSRLQEAEARVSEWLAGLGSEAGVYGVIDPGSLVTVIASLAGDIAGILADLVLALIIAAFLLFRFTKLGTDRSGAVVMRAEPVRRAVREMYRYIAIKTVTSMATGALVGLWLWLVDADLPILFGLLAFLLNYIPTLGSIVAGVLAVGVGLLQHCVEHALLVTAGYIVLNTAIGNIIEPRIMGRALGLWPLVVLLSVVFWGWMLGAIGALLSAMLTQAVKLLLLSTPDLRPIGIALGPRPKVPPAPENPDELLEEAMPQSSRPRGPEGS